jgi:hypothetical protein
MKKSIFALIITCMMVMACKKTSTSPATGQGGSWTVNTNSYPATTCQRDTPDVVLIATNISTLTQPGSDVEVIFYNQFPTASGTYTVVTSDSAMTAPGQVQIGAAGGASGNIYVSSGAGTGQTVNVTVAGGKISVSGTGINMITVTSATATLSLNIHQLQ